LLYCAIAVLDHNSNVKIVSDILIWLFLNYDLIVWLPAYQIDDAEKDYPPFHFILSFCYLKKSIGDLALGIFILDDFKLELSFL
jgi:hypothetical protein